MPYDELALFHENAAEYGLALAGPPVVARRAVDVAPGRRVSALVWGTEPAELVLLHGGAQNAHTWDTVALALGRPLVALDLPGHGHSDWRDDLAYDPRSLAADVAVAVAELAPAATVVCGMSLGGLTSIALAAHQPELVARLVVVDVTPGVNRDKARAVIDFIAGPQSFPSFDDLLARTIEHNPTRSESSLRRGILHNARQLDDGSWVWRYDRRRPDGTPIDADGRHSPLWDDVSAVAAPLLLVRGGLSPVVDDDDVAELRRRQPTAEVVVVEGAGHSVQGDRPLELAALLERWRTA
ncbi:MAG: alpha/beta hydrolase [Acidimicrobiales bacterium]|nr:alpha/beta hydrolase [Acidimicrobiales bacterium]